MPRRSLVDLEWEEVHKHWRLHLGLGILLITLGVVAVAYTFTASPISVFLFGWLLVGSGLAQTTLAFRVQNWGGFFIHLLGGVLEIVVGLLVVGAPAAAAPGLTMLLAVYLLVGGLFRMLAAQIIGCLGSAWAARGGLVSFLLGLVLWKELPLSDLWFLGACVGVNLLLQGAAWIIFAWSMHRVPALPEPLHTTGDPA